MNQIKNAVEPMKQLSVARAVEYAQNRINRTMEKLAADDMNSSVQFGYPWGIQNRAMYMKQKALYDFVCTITQSDSSRPSPAGSRKTVSYVVPNENGVARHIKQVADDAALAFDAYVYKLNQKVGEVTEAQVTTSWDLWMDSNLAVTKADGTKEVWNTKCITNYSKFGLAFNQFPTRLTK